MIAQLQINRVIEIIKDYTTFLSLLLVYIYLDVQSQNDISTILLWRGLNIRYMKLDKIMYQESYPYRVLFLLPLNTRFRVVITIIMYSNRLKRRDCHGL